MAEIRLIKNPFDRKNDLLTINFGDDFQRIVDSLDMPQAYKDNLVVLKLDENLDNAQEISRDKWAETFPKDGEHYQIMVRLSGGGGSGKSSMNMIAMAAIVVAAMVVAPMAAGAAFSAAFSTATTTVAASSLAGASIMGLAGMAVYGLTYGAVAALTLGLGASLIKAPTQQQQNVGETKRSLQGSSNQVSAYNSIPKIYGRTRFSPYKVAPDYTEQVGSDTYLRCLLCFGYGPLKVSEIKIGTDNLSTYSDFEYEIREGWPDDEPLSLYSNTVKSINYSITLSNKNPATIIETLTEVEEASVVISYPGGLWRQSGRKTKPNTSNLSIAYREKGASEWITCATPSYYYSTQTPFTRDIRIQFPKKGTYEISVKKTGGYESYNYDEPLGQPPILSGVRYFSSEYPVGISGLCLMAIRVKSTDQLNGNLNGISALCESYGRVPATGSQETIDTTTIIKKELGTIGSAPTTFTWEAQEPIGNVDLTFQFKDGVYSTMSGRTATSKFNYEWTSDQDSGSGSFTVSGSNSTPQTFKYKLSSDSELTNFKLKITRHSDSSSRKIWTGSVWTTEGRVSGPCIPLLSFSKQTTKEIENENFTWELTRHPAWHVLDMLVGNACVTKVDYDNIDIESFKEWARTYPDWLVDKAIDGNFTRLSCINDMCSAAKALFTNINGKYTIVLDKMAKSPVAAISPRNSFGFSFSKSFNQSLHAFKVKYIEPERDWSEQEVIVYVPGYDEHTATDFESIDTYGCTSRELAFRWGKFMLGQCILRPETYTVSQDVENLIVNLGDLVLLTHDVLKVGIGSARIKQVYRDEQNRVSQLWLDDFFELPQERNYTIIIRDSLGKLTYHAIDGNTKSSDVVELLNPVIMDVQDGDQIFLGETDRVSLRAIITKIEPGDDLTATLTLVPEASEIHDESLDELLPFDPMMTDNVGFGNNTPGKPIVDNIVSDESVLWQDLSGSWNAAISYVVTPQENESADIERVQVFYQEEYSPFVKKVDFPYTGYDVVTLKEVDDEKNYIVNTRYVTRTGLASEWTTITTYVIGKTLPPPNIDAIDRQGYNITWNYENKPKDFAGFRIYYSYGFDTWKDHAVRAHTQSLWDSPPFTTATLPEGILTLFVVAVDNVGNESTNPAVISFYNGDVEYDNILWEYDYANNDFPGEINGGQIHDKRLFAYETSIFYNADSSKFYKEDSEKFYKGNSYVEMTYNFFVEYGGDIENAYIKLDWDMDGVYKIYYRRESENPFYPPEEKTFYKPDEDELFYDQEYNWFLFPDKLLIGKERVEIKVVFAAGEQQGVINKLIAKIDAPDVSETISNVTISATGTRLPITKNFKVINKVFLTLFGGSSAVSYKIIDYNLTGPLVVCYDAEGNMVEGVVDADVRGYM
ncbi:MAG: phage tail protein [Clostridium sp.]|nr:phage tail protein [Clostridium sp.]